MAKLKPYPCLGCGKIRNLAPRDSHKLCRSCVREGANNSNWKGGKKKCTRCNNFVSNKSYSLCMECLITNRVGERNPNWKGGPKKCSDCGEPVSDSSDKRCRECHHKFTRGQNHPLFKGDEHRKHRENEYQQNRIKIDIDFKLRKRLRTRIYAALRFERAGSAVRDLGCTISELKKHLESKFKPGMTWDNWGQKGWHIDHILPLSAFDLTDREQFLRAAHFTNLQPLWAVENIAKKNKRPGTA